MAVGVAAQATLEGMPDPRELHRIEVDGHVLIMVGSRAVGGFPVDDGPMRNMTAVILTGLGFTGRRVAELLGITEEYVSTLRGRARREGSAGLVPRRGRPPALGRRELGRARRMRAQGRTDVEIGRELGVHATTVGRALSAAGSPAAGSPEPALVPGLPLPEGPAEQAPAGSALADDAPGLASIAAADDAAADDAAADHAAADHAAAAAAAADTTGDAAAGDGEDGDGDGGDGAGAAAWAAGRVCSAGMRSRYAGAMLLHPFLDRVGAAEVLSTACGRGPARYDDLGLLTGTCLAFALGVSSVEATKHLLRAQVGPLAGLVALPELRTLRPRLAGLADGTDPLMLQQRLAAAMLAVDAPGLALYFVDDHFVPYAGARPVGKGWNTKRRHAQRGRDDTLVTDYHGRAVCFASGDPAGLSTSLPGALGQLRQVLGADAPIMLGFDRGGSYPAVFRACRDAGAHWLTWRRGPLAVTDAVPVRSFRVDPTGTVETITLADEIVELSGYGPARQLTLFEHDTPVLQVLTSDLTAPAAALLAWLRCRWRIENAFKYLAVHHGIDWLCDYHAETGPDTSKISNPARVAARKRLAAAEAELADAERALAQLLGSDQPHTTINAQIPAAEARIATARDTVAAARTDRDAHPAKLPANTIDPHAQRARHRTRRRALQMVLRLLAYNAEYWLADRLNAYLQDPNEYRAITRHLLHLGGTITYTPEAINVTLDPPATPRLARALTLLIQEINTRPPRLPADRRPITYTTT